MGLNSGLIIWSMTTAGKRAHQTTPNLCSAQDAAGYSGLSRRVQAVFQNSLRVLPLKSGRPLIGIHTQNSLSAIQVQAFNLAAEIGCFLSQLLHAESSRKFPLGALRFLLGH